MASQRYQGCWRNDLGKLNSHIFSRSKALKKKKFLFNFYFSTALKDKPFQFYLSYRGTTEEESGWDLWTYLFPH